MEKLIIKDELFKTRREIKLLNNTKKTGMIGPARMGYSMYRPADIDNPVKLNAIASCLDSILVDKSVNALECSDKIYVEFLSNGILFGAICDGANIFWNYSMPTSHDMILIPVLMYALSSFNNSRFDEIFKIFNDIKLSISSSIDNVSLEDVLMICDSFVYSFTTEISEMIMHTNASNTNTPLVQRGYSLGEFTQLESLNDLSPLPTLQIIEDIKLRDADMGTGRIDSDIFSDCKNGKYILDYEWDESQKNRIPSLKTLDTYIPNEKFNSMCRMISNRVKLYEERKASGCTGVDIFKNKHININIAGKPSSGKTTLAYALSAAFGIPIYTTACTKNTEEDEFQGQNKVIDGKMQFVETNFLHAFTNGGIILLEEVNLPDPAVMMGALGQAIEFPYVLMKNGFQEVKRHPLCIIISTMNIGTYGSKSLSQAFSSRFKQTYILNDPTKKEFISILEMQGFKKKYCEWVHTAYQRIINYLESPQVNASDITLNVTLRSCIGALESIEDGDSPTLALKNTLLGKIAEVDAEIANNVEQYVINNLQNIV